MDIFTAAVVGVWLYAASHHLLGREDPMLRERVPDIYWQRATLLTLAAFILYFAEKVIWPT